MSQDSTNTPTPKDALAAIVYRVNNPRHGDYGSHEDTAAAILAAGWRPPAGDTEQRDDSHTQWGIRTGGAPDILPLSSTNEEMVHELADKPNRTLFRRSIGPWKEVS